MQMPFAISMTITTLKIAKYGMQISLNYPRISSPKMWGTLMGLGENRRSHLALELESTFHMLYIHKRMQNDPLQPL